MTTKNLKMLAVVPGSLWRSESGDTRVARIGSEWSLTVRRFIGGEELATFGSKAELMRHARRHGLKFSLPRS